jgi:hypothetical protein
MGDTEFEVSMANDGDFDIEEEDDEYEYLALPEVDEEFLDEFRQENMQGQPSLDHLPLLREMTFNSYKSYHTITQVMFYHVYI